MIETLSCLGFLLSPGHLALLLGHYFSLKQSFKFIHVSIGFLYVKYYNWILKFCLSPFAEQTPKFWIGQSSTPGSQEKPFILETKTALTILFPLFHVLHGSLSPTLLS